LLEEPRRGGIDAVLPGREQCVFACRELVGDLAKPKLNRISQLRCLIRDCHA
jgi:hypothetical protein